MLGVHMGQSDKVVLAISCERTFLGVHPGFLFEPYILPRFPRNKKYLVTRKGKESEPGAPKIRQRFERSDGSE